MTYKYPELRTQYRLHKVPIYISTLLLILFNQEVLGQADSVRSPGVGREGSGGIELSLLTGYNQGYYGFADIGLEFNKAGATAIHNISVSYSVSNEIKISNKPTVGPKIGLWVAAGPAVGLNLIYYTDFSNSSFVLRPEIGLGVTNFKLVYGYNFKLTNSLQTINTNLIEVIFCFPFRKYNG